MTVWGVHSDQPELDLVGNGFVAIGWDDIGDLTELGSDKDELKERIAAARPWAKGGRRRQLDAGGAGLPVRRSEADFGVWAVTPGESSVNEAHMYTGARKRDGGAARKVERQVAGPDRR